VSQLTFTYNPPARVRRLSESLKTRSSTGASWTRHHCGMAVNRLSGARKEHQAFICLTTCEFAAQGLRWLVNQNPLVRNHTTTRYGRVPNWRQMTGSRGEFPRAREKIDHLWWPVSFRHRLAAQLRAAL